MIEYAIMVDWGAYTVMMRNTNDPSPATRLGSHPTLEAALTEIQSRTGSPVLLKLIVETSWS